MTNQLKADISLLFVTAIWGSSFTLMKNVLDHMPSFAYLSLRFIIASMVLVVVFHRRLKNIKRITVIYGCIIGLMLFGGMAFQVTGLYFTTASNSAFITGLNVIMVPVIAALFLRKRADRNSVIGVILAIVGLFFLTGGLSFRFNRGDFFTLLCAVCFALQIIFIDKFAADEDPMLLALMQVGFAAVLYTVVWLGIDYKPMVFNTTVIYTLIITGVMGTAFAFAVQTTAQKYTSPTHTALIITAEPVFGAVFALIIPNTLGQVETLQLHTIIGCILILLGMIVCELKPVRNRAAVKKLESPPGFEPESS